jgi:hypothetical protein
MLVIKIGDHFAVVGIYKRFAVEPCDNGARPRDAINNGLEELK